METAFCANAAPAEGQAVCLASTNARSLPQRARWPRIFPAWAAEVVSSNIVGYQKINLNSGYNMLGVQFNEVGGSSKTLADVFTGNLPDMEYDETADALVWNAKILQWNGGGYNTYYWVGNKGEEIFEDSSYDNVWVADELGENIASGTIGIGDGFFVWLNSADNATISFSK